MHSRLWPLAWGMIAVVAFSGAWAQGVPSGGESAGLSVAGTQTLKTIIVTAQKRSESLLNVPVAVVPITRSQLQNNLANSLSSIGELAPQVMIGRSVTGTGAVLTIRGISSTAVDSGVDQSVVVDVDGVPISRGRLIETAMFDTSHVQVLEGPQSLFFGKNSPAGVIAITSEDPGKFLGGVC